MKGSVPADGSGTRFHPISHGLSTCSAAQTLTKTGYSHYLVNLLHACPRQS